MQVIQPYFSKLCPVVRHNTLELLVFSLKSDQVLRSYILGPIWIIQIKTIEAIRWVCSAATPLLCCENILVLSVSCRTIIFSIAQNYLYRD
jgi:hypothetical protein